ncbi:MAG: thioredoxin domain-containing protein [Chloroflexota bacterium]
MRRYYFVLIAILLAACDSAPPVEEPPAQPTFTLVPSTTPASVETTYADRIPTGTSAEGYPILGTADAPVQVREFGSYDSPASGAAHRDIFTELLPRIEAGEMAYTFIPLSSTGSIPNGSGAARAALCAGEQGAFWQYHERLYTLQQGTGDVFSGAALIDLVDELGLDREVWNSCVLGDGANEVLRIASEEALELESYTGTPTILVNGNYVLNDVISLNTIADQIIERVESGEPLTLPDDEQLIPQAEATEDLQLFPTTQQSVGVPIEIALPEGWTQSMSDTLLLRDIDAVRAVPFTLWKGPVDGGTGNIVLLWGFPNITTGNPFEAQAGIATPTPNLRVDGLRLLRLAVVEQGCNVGTDLERNYQIGEFTGVGTEWSAVDCPELQDTRGWFVGTRQFNLNYLFYAYIEPIDPAGITESERTARRQIQTILETIRFLPPDELPTPVPAPTETP